MHLSHPKTIPPVHGKIAFQEKPVPDAKKVGDQWSKGQTVPHPPPSWWLLAVLGLPRLCKQYRPSLCLCPHVLFSPSEIASKYPSPDKNMSHWVEGAP